MWKSIVLLSRLQLLNIGGINQIRYGNDSRQKNRFTLQLVIWIVLGVMIAGYSGGMTYGYVYLGAPELIFPTLVVIIAAVTLIFTVYKAGSVLFNMQKYEAMIPLPLPAAAIVVSRFLSMYLQDVVITAVVVLPAMLVYGIFCGPSLLYYPMMIVGIFTIALLPMTVSTAVGAGITAIGSRMKHKNLITVVLTLVVVSAIVAGSLMMPAIGQDLENSELFSLDRMQGMLLALQDQLFTFYPPAKWFTLGVTQNRLDLYLLFTAVSGGAFALLVALVQWKFKEISTALMAHKTSGHYQVGELSTCSVRQALYLRERKMYFSSNIYVINTMMGYIMMVIFAAGILFAGIDKIEEMLGFFDITSLIPYILALMGGIMVTTACAVSIEGNRWWLLQSLPVSMKQIVDSKIKMNLTLGLPATFLSVLFLMIALKPSLPEAVFVILIPVVYVLFASVLGLYLNCRMPVFNWESEAVAVKQGGAMLLTMLIMAGCCLLPMLLAFLAGERWWLVGIIAVAAVAAGTFWLYRKLKEYDIREI